MGDLLLCRHRRRHLRLYLRDAQHQGLRHESQHQNRQARQEPDEEGPEEDPEETNVVLLSSEDYTLNEDGSIDVSCELLKNYNKNDRIQVMFVDEDNQPVLTYKIISKTTANKYVCEFIY